MGSLRGEALLPETHRWRYWAFHLGPLYTHTWRQHYRPAEKPRFKAVHSRFLKESEKRKGRETYLVCCRFFFFFNHSFFFFNHIVRQILYAPNADSEDDELSAPWLSDAESVGALIVLLMSFNDRVTPREIQAFCWILTRLPAFCCNAE